MSCILVGSVLCLLVDLLYALVVLLLHVSKALNLAAMFLPGICKHGSSQALAFRVELADLALFSNHSSACARLAQAFRHVLCFSHWQHRQAEEHGSKPPEIHDFVNL
eukprot:gnl/MRDRNA2_/MRDRNA2_88753_c0_seq1.p1 gnl/MRDRNA2_/MRDRNA2_88753_c0~~gnl/MRDRNA2_/MRDRNA2_88753_c0_seq1.p1  ORF type:complete len:107 (+),score=14.45 gnl/MRDRNA2_/MRDRNA2_88753_c0_seq1:12-332(+)